MCGAGHNFMRGDADRHRGAGASTPMRSLIRRAIGRRHRWCLRRLLIVGGAGRAGPGADAQPGRSAARHHAGGVLGVPARPRRLPEVETAEEGLGPAFNGDELRRLPQRAGHRRRRRDARDARRRTATTADAFRGAQRRRRHADAHVLDAEPRLPAGHAGRRERRRAARADPAVRRRPGRSDSRRDAARARGSVRSRRRRRQRPGRDGHRRRRPASAASAGSGGRRSTRRCWRSPPTPTATRWGSPTICSRRSRRSASAQAQMRRCDPIPDPEDIRDPVTRRRGIDNFEAFMKFLAPLARGAIDDTVRDGERVFAAIGCAACHVPALTTGPSSQSGCFNRKPVPLFSDLLLHDVGTGDGIRQAAGRARRDPDAGAVGPSAPASAAARRQRGHGRGRDPASRERGRAGAARIREAVAVRSCRARGVSEESLDCYICRGGPPDRSVFQRIEFQRAYVAASFPIRRPRTGEGHPCHADAALVHFDLARRGAGDGGARRGGLLRQRCRRGSNRTVGSLVRARRGDCRLPAPRRRHRGSQPVRSRRAVRQRARDAWRRPRHDCGLDARRRTAAARPGRRRRGRPLCRTVPVRVGRRRRCPGRAGFGCVDRGSGRPARLCVVDSAAGTLVHDPDHLTHQCGRGHGAGDRGGLGRRDRHRSRRPPAAIAGASRIPWRGRSCS